MSWLLGRRKDSKASRKKEKNAKTKVTRASSLPPSAPLPNGPDHGVEPSSPLANTSTPNTRPPSSSLGAVDGRVASEAARQRRATGSPKQSPKQSPQQSPRRVTKQYASQASRDAAEARSPAPPNPTLGGGVADGGNAAIVTPSPTQTHERRPQTASATPDSGISTSNTNHPSSAESSPARSEVNRSPSDTAVQSRLGVDFDFRRESEVSADSVVLYIDLGVSFDSASGSPPGGDGSSRLFVSGVAVRKIAEEGYNPAVQPSPSLTGVGGHGRNDDDDNGYVHVDGIFDVEHVPPGSPGTDKDVPTPLRSVLIESIATLKEESVKLDPKELESEIAELNTSYTPRVVKDTRGNRLSAAETISLYLTEKKVSANPFASEMLEFQSQVDMFKLCSESMLLQFKQYVGAEEEAALASLEAGYKIERIKINRLLKAAAIAADPGEIDSPDPISSSDVPFQQGSAHAATENSDQHDGSDAVTSPKSDSGYVPGSVDRADGPAVAGPLRGDDDSEEDDHRDVSSASPDEYADETIRIDDMAAARRKYGSDDATADDAVESPEFSDTVCIDDMASARAAYGGATAASAAGGDKDATSPEFSDTVQVHDMAAARVMYGGAASGAVTGVGGNEPPREMLLAECWNPDTGQIERRPSPDNLIRRNRPQTVWVKPTSPARTDAKLADEIATESTPAPLAVVDDPPIEEDIPENIAPTKRAGWVKASSGEEARKGTI